MRWLVAVWLLAILGTGCGAETGRLSPGEGAGGPSDAGAGEATVRQIWAGTDVDFSGSPTPDGRFLTFADWGTGNLAIRDVATGESWPVTEKGPWDESGDFAQNSVVSPDGREIAYAWFREG